MARDLKKRKLVHISMIGFALLIGRIPALYISLTCFAALLFNIFILPKLTKRTLEKKEDLQRGFSLGLLSYPAILFLLSLIFFEQQVFLAIGWGVMAFGDATAALGGKKWRGFSLPWHQEKSIGGVMSFILFALPATFGLLFLLPQELLAPLPFTDWLIIVAWATLAGALVETIPALIDDNLGVPAAASTVGFYAHHFMLSPVQIAFPAHLVAGLLAILLFMVLSFWSGKIDLTGVLVGGLIALCIFLGGGFLVLGLLLVFFVFGSMASAFGSKRKAMWGLEERNKGRRSAANALANAGVAACCGLLAWLFPAEALFYQLLLAGSLAAALSDTLSSEMGNVFGKSFFNILNFKPDVRGNDGAISLEGSLFGVGGSLLMALSAALAFPQPRTILIVACAGVFGNLVDSLLGATLQQKGLMSNHTVNLACTLSAALFAAALYQLFG